MPESKLSNSRNTKISDQKNNANNGKNKSGFLFTISAVLVALLIIVFILGGAAFFAIRNNFNGIADKYRKQIQAIPVLKLALPALPDPYDPENLTDEELRQKYKELLNIRDDLNQKLKEAEDKITEYEKYRERAVQLSLENERLQNEMTERANKINEEKKQLEEDKAKFYELVAKEDKKGFKEFFEKMDKETADRIYKEIMEEEKTNEEIKRIVKIYENMDPKAAAKILEEMGADKLEFITDILKNSRAEIAAGILEEMDPKLASDITENLPGYKQNTEETEGQ
ncbi:MAG TPA: hypothetical protein GXX14_04350 [Clostridiaceae bacterium]|nr:hypothetical protein [Clostridiaceae bacterium]